MPVLDFVLSTLGAIQNVASAAIVTILTYMICGGWKYVFRAISFFFDTQLVKLIGTVFSYFSKLITLDMFNKELVNELMRNIYVFIGVIMFFRLMMLIIKYLINPDLIGDAKAGMNALIQRVVIGCCGILFIPTIFSLANDLQVAILEDNIIQQLIIPSKMIDAMEDKINQGGSYIGTYVLAGFLSPNSSASSSEVKQFELGVQQGDLSNVDINDGGLFTQKFKYDYFFFISTLALGYVFYYMLKYCIDIAGRCFRLLLYKLISPIAMIEYIINGSQDGVFKQWLTATISTYCMLFVRVLAIWFVLLVTTLMADDSYGYAGTLLTDNDYFLRAIIIIALLGFMMDLPKLVGQVFGLDLEQEGNASGVLKQVGGMVKGAALGGLAIGGAAAGSIVGGLGNLSQQRRAAVAKTNATAAVGGFGLTDKDGNPLKGKELRDAMKDKDVKAQMKKDRRDNLRDNLHDMDKGALFRNAGGGMLSAALGSNQFTGAFAGSFSNNKKAQEQVGENAEAAAVKKAKEKQQEEEDRKVQQAQAVELSKLSENVGKLLAQIQIDPSSIKLEPITLVAKIHPEMTKTSDLSLQTSANVGGKLNATATSIGVSQDDLSTSGTITSGQKREKLVQEVESVMTSQCDTAGIEVPQQVIRAKAETVVDSATFSVDAGGVTAKVNVDIPGAMEEIACHDQTVTRIINDVQGSSVSVAPREIERVVNDVQGSSASVAPREIERVVNDVQGSSVSVAPREIERVVNDVQGSSVSVAPREIERVVNDVQGSSASVAPREIERVVNDVQVSDSSTIPTRTTIDRNGDEGDE